MSPADLCIGIVACENTCEVATLDASGAPERVGFPVSQLGRAALRVFLAGQSRPLRLAVSGDAAMGLAFAVGPAAGCDIYIVARGVADHPADLARYASRAL
ncbi:MAG: hypothetical protein JNK97_14350 [Zoogloea sp.]|nr:hypothetical protein [Zoogloea sp.]